MMTQKQRERAPRRDRVYSTDAERHRAYRARKKLARETAANYAAIADEVAESIRAFAALKPELYGYLDGLSVEKLLEQFNLEIRERKGPLWDSFHDSGSVGEDV
jgi:hypothetical protein